MNIFLIFLEIIISRLISIWKIVYPVPWYCVLFDDFNYSQTKKSHHLHRDCIQIDFQSWLENNPSVVVNCQLSFLVLSNTISPMESGQLQQMQHLLSKRPVSLALLKNSLITQPRTCHCIHYAKYLASNTIFTVQLLHQLTFFQASDKYATDSLEVLKQRFVVNLEFSVWLVIDWTGMCAQDTIITLTKTPAGLTTSRFHSGYLQTRNTTTRL